MLGSSERLRPVARREIVHAEVAAGRGTVAERAVPFPFFAPLPEPVTLITDTRATPGQVTEIERDPHPRVRRAART